jgi:hypothetical protein
LHITSAQGLLIIIWTISGDYLLEFHSDSYCIMSRKYHKCDPFEPKDNKQCPLTFSIGWHTNYIECYAASQIHRMPPHQGSLQSLAMSLGRIFFPATQIRLLLFLAFFHSVQLLWSIVYLLGHLSVMVCKLGSRN